MTTLAQPEIPCRVTGGVDTHKDQHVAAALDQVGRLLGIAEFPATTAGYQQLHAWLAGHGEIIGGRDTAPHQHRSGPCRQTFPDIRPGR